MTPTVGLTMIVKDAEQSLPVLLGSLNDVADPKLSTIIDTGSTDKTVDVLREWGARPLRRKWRNFQHNRTELMAKARGKADYLLLLDADMELSWRHDGLELDRDVVNARILYSGLDYALPFFVRGDRFWEYKGYAHSYLSGEVGMPVSIGETDAFTIIDHSHPTDEKIRRDLDLLWQELRDTEFDNPRAWYYLAQTYRDLGRPFDAIAMYYMRSRMGGFEEERWHALYQAGSLAVENQSFQIGADLLLEAYKQRPHRAEPLRALAGSATSVADKIPYPVDDVLFVWRPHYKEPMPALMTPTLDKQTVTHGPSATRPGSSASGAMPPFPSIEPTAKRAAVTKAGVLLATSVTAIVVTRGNVDLEPVIGPMPYGDVVVWNNSQAEERIDVPIAGRTVTMLGGTDYKPFGRYAAIPHAQNPVIYWQDDDVVFTAHGELLAAYQGGRLVTNMDDSWIDGAGYRGVCGMQGAGSLCESWLPAAIWKKYLERYPWDEEALVEADFVFGALVPFDVVDLGYEAREFADDPDRLYQQPGQTERKHAMIARCRALLGAV